MRASSLFKLTSQCKNATQETRKQCTQRLRMNVDAQISWKVVKPETDT